MLESIARLTSNAIRPEIGQPWSTDLLKRNLIIFAAENYRGQYSQDQPPEFLEHIWQVYAVSRAMIDESALSTSPDAYKGSEVYVFTHDEGRTIDLRRTHTIIGARMLEELGLPESVVTFACNHHRWGMGMPVLGAESFAQRAIKFLDGQGNIDPAIELESLYGPEGLIVIVADNTKSHLDPNHPHRSSITEFSLELGERLIQKQITNGSFQDGRANHQVERYGPRFLLHLINYLKNNYDLNYQGAVKSAQQNWPGERDELVRLWAEITYGNS